LEILPISIDKSLVVAVLLTSDFQDNFQPEDIEFFLGMTKSKTPENLVHLFSS